MKYAKEILCKEDHENARSVFCDIAPGSYGLFYFVSVQNVEWKTHSFGQNDMKKY